MGPPAGGIPSLVLTPNAREPKRGRGEWSNGLFSCLGDAGTCLLATFAPCMLYSKNRSRLVHLEQQGYAHPSGGDSCTPGCALYAVLFPQCLSTFVASPLRRRIRARYSISASSSSDDCLTTLFCPCCALEQESREISVEEARLYNESGGMGRFADLEPVGCGDVGCFCCKILLQAGSDPWCWW